VTHGLQKAVAKGRRPAPRSSSAHWRIPLDRRPAHWPPRQPPVAWQPPGRPGRFGPCPQTAILSALQRPWLPIAGHRRGFPAQRPWRSPRGCWHRQSAAGSAAA